MNPRHAPPKVIALDVGGRPDPSDHATEESVIAAAIHDARGRAELLAALPAEDVHNSGARRVWEVVASLEAEGVPVDLRSLSSRLHARDWLQDLGGVEYLDRIMERGQAMRSHAFAWCRHLRDLAQRRRIIRASSLVIGEAYTIEPDQAASFPARALEQVADACIVESATGGPQAIGDLTKRRFAELQEQWTGKRDPWGMPLPFKRTNVKVHGFRRGEVVIIGGDTGSGKSVYAQQIALDVAGRTHLGERVAVGMIGLEMPKDDYWDRAVCALAEDMSGRPGAITEAELQEGPRASDGSLDIGRAQWIEAATRRLEGMPFFIEDGGHNMTKVHATVRRFQAMARRAGCRLGMVILDHMHLLEYRGYETQAIAVGDATRQMKRIAVDSALAFVSLGQFKREASDRAPTELPRITALKEGSAIEQIADKMILLHRPWMLYPDKNVQAAKDCKNVVRALIAKNRKGGGLGSVAMHFAGEYRFDEDDTND